MVVRLTIQIEIEFGRNVMGDWMDDLKQKEDAERDTRLKEQDWELRCDRLIMAKGPDLWQELVTQVRAEIKRLTEKFPGNESRRLTIEEYTSRYSCFTLKNPVTGKSLTACFQPEARRIQVQSISLANQSSEQRNLKLTISKQDEVLLDGARYVNDEASRLVRALGEQV